MRPLVSPGLSARLRFIALSATTLASVALPLLWSEQNAKAANQIALNGVVAQNCTIAVTADPNASNLTLTGGTQHITVGTIVQNCNKKAGYTIVVTSTNCAAAPAGAKLTGTASGETLTYSVEQINPTTGGSTADVANLLKTTCSAQNGRVVTNAKITGETSTVYANYTGSSALAADTYQDTLTFTMNVN